MHAPWNVLHVWNTNSGHDIWFLQFCWLTGVIWNHFGPPSLPPLAPALAWYGTLKSLGAYLGGHISTLVTKSLNSGCKVDPCIYPTLVHLNSRITWTAIDCTYREKSSIAKAILHIQIFWQTWTKVGPSPFRYVQDHCYSHGNTGWSGPESRQAAVSPFHSKPRYWPAELKGRPCHDEGTIVHMLWVNMVAEKYILYLS